MTLIELLRYHGQHCLQHGGEQARMCLDAADEIERLRNEISKLSEQTKFSPDANKH